AAARTAAPERGIRPLYDFHALQVEDLAGLAARIAYTVDIHIVAGRAAADEGAISQRLPALPGAERDPRRIAQYVLQGSGRAVLDDRARYDLDRLGRIQQRRRELCLRRLGYFIRIIARAGD